MVTVKDSHKKVLLINTGIIAGGFLVAAIGIYFLGNDISSRAEAIQEGRALIAERSEKINALSSLSQQEQEARELEQKLAQLLPREGGLLSFSEHLETVARSVDVDTDFSFSGSPSDPTKTAPGMVNFDLEARGGLRNIQNFLSVLEFQGTRFLVEVASVNISNTGEDYRANINGKIFFRQANDPDDEGGE